MFFDDELTPNQIPDNSVSVWQKADLPYLEIKGLKQLNYIDTRTHSMLEDDSASQKQKVL